MLTLSKTIVPRCSRWWWEECVVREGMLTNVIVTGSGESCNLVREGKMFVRDESKIPSRVGGVK